MHVETESRCCHCRVARVLQSPWNTSSRIHHFLSADSAWRVLGPARCHVRAVPYPPRQGGPLRGNTSSSRGSYASRIAFPVFPMGFSSANDSRPTWMDSRGRNHVPANGETRRWLVSPSPYASFSPHPRRCDRDCRVSQVTLAQNTIARASCPLL